MYRSGSETFNLHRLIPIFRRNISRYCHSRYRHHIVRAWWVSNQSYSNRSCEYSWDTRYRRLRLCSDFIIFPQWHYWNYWYQSKRKLRIRSAHGGTCYLTLYYDPTYKLTCKFSSFRFSVRKVWSKLKISNRYRMWKYTLVRNACGRLHSTILFRRDIKLLMQTSSCIL